MLESERRYSPHTVGGYRRDIYAFFEWCGVAMDDFDTEAFKRYDINDWAVYLFEKRGLKASSVNRSLASLRSFWKWMLKQKYTTHDIVSTIKQFKTPKIHLQHWPPQAPKGVARKCRAATLSEHHASSPYR